MSLGEIKNSGETLELSGTHRPHFGRLSANIGRKPTNEFSKIWHFSGFQVILGNFFFQNENLTKKSTKMIKNGFFLFLWILKMTYIHFLVIFDHLKIWLFQNFFNVILLFKTKTAQHDMDFAHILIFIQIWIISTRIVRIIAPPPLAFQKLLVFVRGRG